MALTPKQARFVEEYLKDLNATQAAIRAGYSEKTANEQGAQLLAKPAIMAAVDAAKVERSLEAKIDAIYVLRRLYDEAEADLADIYDENGDLLPVAEWPEIWRKGLVQGIEVEELFDGRGDDRKLIGHVRKVRLSDRVRRIELLGKHVLIGAFQEIVKVGALDDLANRLARAGQRDSEPAPPVAPPPVPTHEPPPDVHPLHERMRRISDREGKQPELAPDWREPPAPVYTPILPTWPEQSGQAETEYETMPGSLLSAYRST